jgi:hypothetical protein
MNRRSVGMLVLARITIRERLASRILHDISAGDAFGSRATGSGGTGAENYRRWSISRNRFTSVRITKSAKYGISSTSNMKFSR